MTTDARNYRFRHDVTVYEDTLPDDMTDADYSEWFEWSFVDFVRKGPQPVRLPSPTSEKRDG